MRRWVAAAVAAAFVAASSVATAPNARAATAPPGAPTHVTATAGTLSATVKWTPADATATSFTVVAAPGGYSATVNGTTTSATVIGLGFAQAYTFTVRGTNASGAGPASAASNSVVPTAPGGAYHDLPNVVLINADITSTTPLATNFGDDPLLLPSISAVVVNVTASNATATGGIQIVVNNAVVQTVFVSPGQTESSLAVIALNVPLTQGAIRLTAGKAHIEVDVVGYVTAPKSVKDHSGLLRGTATQTLFDGQLAASAATDIPVLGQGGVPSSHVADVLLNVMAIGATGTGVLGLRASGGTSTNATALGFATGQTTADRAIVPVGSNGAITLVDRVAAVHARVDVVGWFSDATDGSAIGALYTPLTPARLVDTASHAGPVPAAGSLSFPVWGQGGAPAGTATAPPTTALLQVTAVSPSGAGSIGFASTSVVDFAPGQTVAGVVWVQLATDGSASFTVLGAATNVTVDLIAFYSGDIVLPGSTKVLTANQLAGITNLGSDLSVTFAPGTQVSPPIQLNDVIAAGPSPTTPDGLLRRVLSISVLADGSTVLGTRTARIPEAITSFTLDWTLPPGTGTAGMSRGMSQGAIERVARPINANPLPPPPGTSIDPSWPIFAIAVPPVGLIFDLSQLDPGLRTGSEFDINDFEIQMRAHMSMDLSPSGTFHLSVAFSVGYKLSLELQLLAQISLLDKRKLLDHLFPIGGPIAFLVGIFPIEFQPFVEASFELKASLDGGVVIDLNLDRYRAISGGYNGSSFFLDPPVDKDYLQGQAPLTIRPSVQAQAEVDLHLEPNVRFYGGLGVIASDAYPFARGTVDPTAPQWWTVQFGVCIQFEFQLNLIFFTNDQAFLPTCLLLYTFGAPGPLIVVTITPSPATVPRSGTQTFNATVAGVPVPVAWSLVEANAGTLSNVGLTSVDYTAPSRAGTYHLQAAAVADPTSNKVIAITVPATAPGLATNVTATLLGGTAVTVSWSAPTDDGGAAITDYKVVSSDGTVIDAGTNTTTTFSNLTPGTTYTFSVYATNSANQTSAASLSPPVTVPTQAVVTLTPTSIDFGANALGTPTQPQTVTVTVSGGSVNIASVTLGGTRPQDYSIVNDQCTNVTIDPRGSCTFQVIFTAAVQDQSTATVLVTDDALGSPQSMALQGQGPLPLINGFSAAGPARFFDLQHGTVGNFNTADGGTTWTPQQFAGGYPGFLNYGAYFLDPSHGWELGAPLAAFTPGCLPGASCKVVLYTSDGGVTWTRLSVINFLLDPRSIVFTDSLHGWISGLSYTCDSTGNNCVPHQVLATTDGGLTWTVQPLAAAETCTAPLTLDQRGGPIDMLDSSNGWILGASACVDSSFNRTNPLTLLWSTNDGGAHWSVHDTGLNANQFVSSQLHAISLSRVAFTIQDLSAPGEGTPFFVQTTDGGATWTRSAIPDAFAGDFQYVDATHIVLIGGANGSPSLYSSADGGATWTKVGPLPGQVPSSNPNPNFTELHFLTVFDATHWWITGQIDYVSSTGASTTGGLILLSSDGGVTWKIVLEGTGS